MGRSDSSNPKPKPEVFLLVVETGDGIRQGEEGADGPSPPEISLSIADVCVGAGVAIGGVVAVAARADVCTEATFAVVGAWVVDVSIGMLA